MIRRVVSALLYVLVLGGSASAQTCTLPVTLTNGTNADATQVMQNFTALLNCVGGLSGAPQGRLTLQSGVPVMTTSQAGRTAILYTPYIGNQIPIYNGTTMLPTTFSELSAATSDTTKNPSPIGAGKVNDWFVWNDAGTIRLSHGPDWTNDTTRSAGTALVRQNGILLNNVAITNGPDAQRGTYVGTTRSDASSQLNWIFGQTGSGGVAAFLNVWNAYNRVQVATSVIDNGANYTYTSGTFRQARGSAGNQINFVIGLQEDGAAFNYVGTFSPATTLAAAVQAPIGFDSTTALNAPRILQLVASNQSASRFTGTTATTWVTPIGYHFAAALEAGDGTNVNTFDFNSDNYLNATFRM